MNSFVLAVPPVARADLSLGQHSQAPLIRSRSSLSMGRARIPHQRHRMALPCRNGGGLPVHRLETPSSVPVAAGVSEAPTNQRIGPTLVTVRVGSAGCLTARASTGACTRSTSVVAASPCIAATFCTRCAGQPSPFRCSPVHAGRACAGACARTLTRTSPPSSRRLRDDLRAFATPGRLVSVPRQSSVSR